MLHFQVWPAVITTTNSLDLVCSLFPHLPDAENITQDTWALENGGVSGAASPCPCVPK